MDVLEISPNLNRTVYYRDIFNIPDWKPFCLNGCMVRKDPRGMLKYTAELLDSTGSCVIMAKLCDVLTETEYINQKGSG